MSDVIERFDYALEQLLRSSDLTRASHLPRLLTATRRLASEPGGLAHALDRAGDFASAGVFSGTDWDHPERLQPTLARGSLNGPADLFAIETLSRLRLLAIAEKRLTHPELEPERAARYLERSLVLNLDLLDQGRSEAERAQAVDRQAVGALLAFELGRIGSGKILAALVSETDRILEQQPIDLSPVRNLLGHIRRLIDSADDPHAAPVERAAELLLAFDGPPEIAADLDQFWRLERASRHRWLEDLGHRARATGLASPVHADILRELGARGTRDEIALSLGLDQPGQACLGRFEGLVRAVIQVAMRPATAQSLVALAHMLERGVLFFPPVPAALWRLMHLPLLPVVAEQLNMGDESDGAPSATGRLLAGVVSVLGLPLGVGQGNNPACQSARAISLWAQCDPGFLLEMITWAARDGEIDLHFEGDLIRSSDLSEGLIDDLHTDLDTVSLLLVPHLDKIYWEMGRRTAGRGEDGHRWINPEFHGWWVHRHFATTIELATGAVVDFAGFIRRFFAAYHPEFNGGADLIYPQPAGIVSTDPFGQFIGWHAISIQRVGLDPAGQMRVYFYNPNNEGRQDWGQGVVTSTRGQGEQPGECSLPFQQFCARLYVFHYNERELGAADQVPPSLIESIAQAVRDSWAADKAWQELVTA